MLRFLAGRVMTIAPPRAPHLTVTPERFFRLREFSTKNLEPPPSLEELSQSKNPSPVGKNMPKPTCTVVYDGSCPVCKRTIRSLNLEDAELINARQSENPLVKKLEGEGHNFDESMVVIKDGKTFTGAEAVQELGKQQGGPLGTILRNVGPRAYEFFKDVRSRLIDETITDQRAREAKLRAEPQETPETAGLKKK